MTVAPALDTAEVWFVTGSQGLYGQDVIRQVEEHSADIAARLDTAGAAIEQRRSHGWTVPDGLLPEQQTAVAPPKRPAADERIA